MPDLESLGNRHIDVLEAGPAEEAGTQRTEGVAGLFLEDTRSVIGIRGAVVILHCGAPEGVDRLIGADKWAEQVGPSGTSEGMDDARVVGVGRDGDGEASVVDV